MKPIAVTWDPHKRPNVSSSRAYLGCPHHCDPGYASPSGGPHSRPEISDSDPIAWRMQWPDIGSHNLWQSTSNWDTCCPDLQLMLCLGQQVGMTEPLFFSWGHHMKFPATQREGAGLPVWLKAALACPPSLTSFTCVSHPIWPSKRSLAPPRCLCIPPKSENSSGEIPTAFTAHF